MFYEDVSASLEQQFNDEPLKYIKSYLKKL